MAFSGVHAANIPHFWRLIEQDLGEILRQPHANHDCWQICTNLMRRDMQLWCDFENGKVKSFCITQIVCGNEFNTCWVLYACGKFDNKWLDFMTMIEEWAISKGCQFNALQGRRAWAKVLMPLGYEIAVKAKDFVSLRKRLTWAAAEAKAQLQ